jgi:osmotically-inducible protein OsmY
LGLVLAACTSSGQSKSNAAEAAAQSPASCPSDYAISSWVREAFELDPRVASDDIAIDTVDGVVTLSGTTSNLIEQRYAKLEAKKIDGVRGVIDETVVAPSARPDREIKHDVELRLANSPFGRIRNSEVSVAHGDVTLAGDVPSWALRDAAERLVCEVRGVRSVTNELSVNPSGTATDDEKRDAIAAELQRDPYLTGLPIGVLVKDDVATLEGTVGNAYEKERAEEDAYLATSLNHLDNRLFVDWFEVRGVREVAPRPNDDQIAKFVRQELDLDSRLAEPSDIDVEVSEGRVTLSGSVPSTYERRLAEQDARNVVGVSGVTDLVSVSDQRRDDQAIANGVTIELGIDYALNGRDIGVQVSAGEVTLTGQVGSYFQKRHATDVAARVAGVRDVVNEITMSAWPGYTDEETREGISRHLASNWKTRPVADRIHVSVEGGSAILSGTVDSWSERVEAERLAWLTEGVSDVKDDLVVEFR